MKKSGASPALLTPDAEGWRLISTAAGGASARHFPSLAEAAAALPAAALVELALPCQSVLLERMKLPSLDRTELAGMVELQLEKTLPFAVDEVVRDFTVIAATETESTVLSIAVATAQLEMLCQPLRARGGLPEKVAPLVLSVAALCPPTATVLAIYPELGQLVLAVCENARLSSAQIVSATDAETLLNELPQLLLTNEMEGVPASFASIQLASDCAPLAEALREFFQVPVELFSLSGELPDSPINLVPPTWKTDVDRQRRAARRQGQIVAAGFVYLLLLAAAFAHLAWLKHESQKMDIAAAAARPQVEAARLRQVRWNALAPAVDPSRSVVEILFQLTKNLPAEGLNVTEFDQLVTQWKVVGEAPSASLAIDYVTRLKDEKELSVYQISSSPPALLPNEHAQFSIFGKL